MALSLSSLTLVLGFWLWQGRSVPTNRQLPEVGNMLLKVISTLCTALTARWFRWGSFLQSVQRGKLMLPSWSRVTTLGWGLFFPNREGAGAREGRDHLWRRALRLSAPAAFTAARDLGQGRVPCTHPAPAPPGKLLREK